MTAPTTAPTDAAASTVATGLFAGGGEVGALMGAMDWAQTPLGPVESWPQSLRTTVRILLTSRFAMWMAWGPELTFLYNDTYSKVTLGKKHPWALGKAAPEVWSEIWNDIGHLVRHVLDGGPATWDEGLLLFLERSGYREETYHTFSYSPLSDDAGHVAGLFCVVAEETVRVIGERRLRLLRSLAAELGQAILEAEVVRAIEASLGQDEKDLPFTLTYLFEDGRARLACCSGIEAGHAAAPKEIDLDDADAVWPAIALLAGQGPVTVEGLAERFGALPCGAWDVAPERAVVVPLQRQGQELPAGFFVAGLNPFRKLDAEYSGFIDLIAGQIAAALSNARVYEQERQRAESLAALDRAKTIFFSNVSHEFRTPLTLMLGPLEDILSNHRETLPAEDYREVETVHRNGLRLLKLVNTLLDFSRIEAGRIQAAYRPVDLSARTAELASVFQSAMDRAGLRYTIACEELPEPVYVDPEMWEKIVLNLVSNAFKFTLQGGVDVTLRPVEGMAVLAVRDTGTGIPADELPRIFERFHRIEGAEGRTHEGTGIGLALVDELVRLHGGTVLAESQMGEGTTFRVRIPFGRAHLAAERITEGGARPARTLGAAPFVQEALRWLPDGEQGEAQMAKEMASTDLTLDADFAADGLATGRRGRVLLADDNRDMREYVQRLLGRQFRVTAVADGEAALASAIENPPDLVLTDIMMPRMDGFELLRALRAEEKTATIPVILLSARAGDEAEAGGLEAGADDYLVKPFTARELMARVGSHIAMHQLRKDLTAKEHELRRKAETAEQQYRTILETISEGFVFMDRDWKVRYANVRWLEIAGLEMEQALARNLWDLFPGMKGTIFGTAYREAMETGEDRSAEEYFEPLGRWFHANAYPSPDGLSIFVQDITEQRMQQEKLMLSEKLAATGRLAATIAHEINNPLESVLNLIYLARISSPPSGMIGEYLSTAEKEITRVSHIARHTLGFYRETSVASDIDMTALLEEVLTVYDSRLRASGIEVVRDFRIVPMVRALRGELHQVFSNLISNAIDAMRDGGRLKIGVREAKDGARPGLTLTVEDTGTGIPRGNLGRLFEPFFTTKVGAGTGLGLWVVRQFVTSWGGTIDVASEVDVAQHGTRFTIFVPLAAGAEAQNGAGGTLPTRTM
ncbi:MAG: ATP-binding protein [Acidobacteriaceae bacterium]